MDRNPDEGNYEKKLNWPLVAIQSTAIRLILQRTGQRTTQTLIFSGKREYGSFSMLSLNQAHQTRFKNPT